MSQRRRLFTARVAAVAAFALLPCAIAADQDTALRERVESWWNARVRQDNAGMYALYDPEYRAKVAYETFLPENTVRARVPIQGFRVKYLSVNGEMASVGLEVDLMAHWGGAGTTLVEEQWILRPSGWFKAYAPAYTPFNPPAR